MKIKEKRWVEKEIGETETYRVLENVTIQLPCSACHKKIIESKIILAFCNGRGLRLHEKCWDGKGRQV